ncbi:MAG TPA: porin [Vicinamibacteria bacterium]|nr:porin [Vicinamibacteria bacterium]
MTSRLARRCLVGAGALLLALLAATNARAQGMFYAEEVKDGRVYVFNIKANWERFKASGETGTGLTRLNAGPNGETVYADNETALELYFFKHGINEVVERPKTPTQRIEWRDGKTRITAGDNFYMELSNRIQVRFTQEMPDDSIQLPGTAARGDGKGSFRIRRAKMKMEGFLYRPWLEYETQLNWPDVTGTPASRFLEDANIDWDVTKGQKTFRVRFGQFKAPYGRQQLTSSGAQQFVDRSIVDERYNPARETGLALWGTLGVNRLDWRVMISNGNGRSQSLNDNDKYLYSARLMWQPNGATRMNQWGSGALLTEGDLDSTDKPLYAIAGNYANNSFFNVTTGNDIKFDQYGGDVIFKYRGFSVTGEYTMRKATPETGAEFDDSGYHIQASYALKTPKLGPASFWELAVRYATIDPTDLVSNNDRKEVGGALSYYYNRHNLKVQADYRQVEDDAANSGRGTKNKEFRLQTQFIF